MPPAAVSSAVRTIADLVSSHLQVAGDEVVSRVAQKWEQHPAEDGMAVLEETRVRYLSRTRFFHQLGKKFGYSLFENRPVSLLAEDGSTVEADMDPIEVISLASQRDADRVFDHILVLEGGRFVGLVSMRDLLVHHRTLLVTGVAERALLEEENRVLGDRTRLQGQLVGNLTRELRAPVNTMVALARSLVADPELPGGHRRALEAITSRAADVLGFVNDLTDLARLESGRFEPVAELSPLEPLLQEALAEAETQLGARAPAIALSTEGGPVRIDVEFLRRIVGSLLGASAHLSGQIALRARASDGRLELRFTLAGAEPEALQILLSRDRGGMHSSGPEIRIAVARGLAARLGGTLDALAPPEVGFAVRLAAPLA